MRKGSAGKRGQRRASRAAQRAVGGLLLAAAAFLASPVAAGEPVIVQAPVGGVSGEAEDGLTVFRGVPYAEAPVGDLRWKPPVPVAAWDGVRDAADFGPACVQPPSRPGSIYLDEPPRMDEDCLSLNIWAPEGAENLPVFIWIHGGSLITGRGSADMYDGSGLARQGLIVVTINYRLGALGYMAHPELSAESERGISGNYGLLDQIEALRWVNANIAAFGGDPDQVTIAGESAGALSVTYLMASPEARGLFHRAVAQSAYMVTTPTLRGSPNGMPPQEAAGLWLQDKLSADNLAEMREMDAGRLTRAAAAEGFFPWGTVDGVILPDQLVSIFDRGEQAQVPVLAGFNEGEIRSLRFLSPPIVRQADDYEEGIAARYRDLASAYLAAYPSGDIEESSLAAARDGTYGWTAERLARKQAAAGQPGFLYYFDHGYPSAEREGLHAFHASEIPYVFGTEDQTPEYWPSIPSDRAERALGDAIQAYWAAFARTGNPGAAGGAEWPAFAEDVANLHIGDTAEVRTGLHPGRYELHEEAACRKRAAGLPWTWNIGLASPALPPKGTACP